MYEYNVRIYDQWIYKHQNRMVLRRFFVKNKIKKKKKKKKKTEVAQNDARADDKQGFFFHAPYFDFSTARLYLTCLEGVSNET